MKSALRWLLTAFVGTLGVLHFARTSEFVRMVPPSLPAPLVLVYVSGVAELLGAIGIQIPRLRRAAAWGLIALFLAVFPANVYMAIHHLSPTGLDTPAWALWVRLPFQAVFIAWAWWIAR